MLVYYFQVGPRDLVQLPRKKKFAGATKLLKIHRGQLRRWRECHYGGGGGCCNSGWRCGKGGVGDRGGSGYDRSGSLGATNTSGAARLLDATPAFACPPPKGTTRAAAAATATAIAAPPRRRRCAAELPTAGKPGDVNGDGDDANVDGSPASGGGGGRGDDYDADADAGDGEDIRQVDG